MVHLIWFFCSGALLSLYTTFCRARLQSDDAPASAWITALFTSDEWSNSVTLMWCSDPLSFACTLGSNFIRVGKSGSFWAWLRVIVYCGSVRMLPFLSNRYLPKRIVGSILTLLFFCLRKRYAEPHLTSLFKTPFAPMYTFLWLGNGTNIILKSHSNLCKSSGQLWLRLVRSLI